MTTPQGRGKKVIKAWAVVNTNNSPFATMMSTEIQNIGRYFIYGKKSDAKDQAESMRAKTIACEIHLK